MLRQRSLETRQLEQMDHCVNNEVEPMKTSKITKVETTYEVTMLDVDDPNNQQSCITV